MSTNTKIIIGIAVVGAAYYFYQQSQKKDKPQ